MSCNCICFVLTRCQKVSYCKFCDMVFCHIHAHTSVHRRAHWLSKRERENGARSPYSLSLSVSCGVLSLPGRIETPPADEPRTRPTSREHETRHIYVFFWDLDFVPKSSRRSFCRSRSQQPDWRGKLKFGGARADVFVSGVPSISW